MIAVATDLLAALEHTLEFLLGCDPGRADAINNTVTAKAAIAKAKGGV